MTTTSSCEKKCHPASHIPRRADGDCRALAHVARPGRPHGALVGNVGARRGVGARRRGAFRGRCRKPCSRKPRALRAAHGRRRVRAVLVRLRAPVVPHRRRSGGAGRRAFRGRCADSRPLRDPDVRRGAGHSRERRLPSRWRPSARSGRAPARAPRTPRSCAALPRPERAAVVREARTRPPRQRAGVRRNTVRDDRIMGILAPPGPRPRGGCRPRPRRRAEKRTAASVGAARRARRHGAEAEKRAPPSRRRRRRRFRRASSGTRAPRGASLREELAEAARLGQRVVGAGE